MNHHRSLSKLAAFMLLLMGACSKSPQPASGNLPGHAATTRQPSLQLVGYGCAGALKPSENAVRAENGGRIEYRYSGITEWYQRNAGGIEQGFTLERPPCREAADVEVEVGVQGLTPRLAKTGDGADLVDERGALRLRYTDLNARDASGRALRATMSIDGGHIALRVDTRDAIYPVVVDPEVWTQNPFWLEGIDGSQNDGFGNAVSASGGNVLIGASHKTAYPAGAPPTGNSNQGEAYVFAENQGAFSQQGSPLIASDGSVGDNFGSAVSLSGDTAVVGASNKTVGGKVSQGAAYVFVRTGTDWIQQGPALSRTDGAAADHFGCSVSLSGNTALVGANNKTVGGNSAQGAAYVFVRTGTTWAQQGPPLPRTDGAVQDTFGYSVSVSGDTALVGAAYKGSAAQFLQGGPLYEQGAAYVFVRNGTAWSQQGPPLARTDGGTLDTFGSAVSVSGDTALVGAPLKGYAYVFVRSGTTWSQQGPSLTHIDSAGQALLGVSVSISGDTVLIGAQGATVGTNAGQGAAYLFARIGTVWSQQERLAMTDDGAPGDGFGSSVSIAGDLAAIGAYAKAGAGHAGLIPGQGTVVAFSDGPCTQESDCPTEATCSSGICITRCAHDSDCVTGKFCSLAGVCQLQFAQGAACDETAGNLCKEASCRVCAAGSCADGVCCDTACNGACEACLGALTGGKDGACLPIPVDQDPQNECVIDPNYPESCQADGLCDGARACRKYAKSGTACGDTTCLNGSVSGKVCSGAGGCETNTVACEPYLCGTSECTSSCKTDADCNASTGYCLNGTCAEVKPLGSACKNNDECVNGFCVDGLCCDSACDAQCEACSSKGRCSPVTGAPRGSRKACDGDPDVCGGTCDGANVTGCKYASTTKACQCDTQSGQPAQHDCDGNGSCSSSTTNCGGYQCGGKACLLACTGESDCADGYTCSKGLCAPSGAAKCSGDLTSSTPAGGTAIPCVAYTCDGTTGSCRTQCTSIDDCGAGYICDSTKNCLPSAAPSNAQDGGCGCRMASSSRSTRPSLGLLLLLCLGLRRRRVTPSPRVPARRRP